ncbi:unnamed protein product [Hermetia illucens]|uniref:Mitochondrial GTPase 1 n=2 Tax=Hermetia illucens TaxID=343691 RepID=A0A7R8YSM1_HERIL|nr:unnamed protein product [Hermetia illucens]
MASNNFRKVFQLTDKNTIRWFPGHMGKGLRQMQQQLKNVDCIIEVHDARLPISGRNPDFKHTIGGLKPHILALNKKDLTDTSLNSKLISDLKRNEGIDHVIYTNCKDHNCKGTKRLMPLAKDLIQNSDRFNRGDSKDFCIMVIGVPNVGKSSLLNVMRNRYLKQPKAAAVGAIAGITRSVMNKIKVSEDPLVYMIDTPGILTPRIADDEMGMKLALCGCLPDHLVGEELIADYLLYWLNRWENFKYVELMGLQEPTDNIMEVLVSGAKLLGRTQKRKHFDGSVAVVADIQSSAQFFVKHFRKGYFGKVNLDAEFPS